jgi:phage-related protein (TIGR01555 family)
LGAQAHRGKEEAGMLGKALTRLDGWLNAVTGLGQMGRDKRLAAAYQTPSEFAYRDLDSLYRGSWLVARACDRPSSEMVRKWLEVKAGDDADMGKDILKAVNRLGAKEAFKQANIWAYLYGGGLVLMGIDDGQIMDMPVREESIRGIDYLRVLDRYDVNVAKFYTSEEKPGSAGMPSSYRLNTVMDATTVGVDPIHETRFLRFDGVVTPMRRRITQNMWCDGLVTRLFERLRGHDTAWGGIEHLLNDFAQAVFKCKDLDKLLAEDGSNDLLQRLALMDMARSVARMVVLDAETEDFERKPTPINGLGQVMGLMMEHLAGILEMPVAVLFGKATPGIGDTGNSQLQQWYDRIALDQETRIVPQGTRLARYMALSMGYKSDDLSVDPLPLKEMSEKEQADLHETQAKADVLMIDRGVVSDLEVRRSRYGGDGYSLNTVLDETTSEMLEVQDEPLPEPGQEPVPVPAPVPAPDVQPGAEPQKTAMNGAQIQALAGVLTAYNNRELTREQAAGIIEIGFLVGSQEAASLVGEREEKPEPPAQLQPFAQPGQKPESESEPEPEPDEIKDDSDLHEDYKRHVGNKWIVYSESGKKLGEHSTEKEADEQLRAIEASKARR